MLYSFLNAYTADFLAFFTSLIIMLLCGKKFIKLMRAWQHEGQPIRECGPKSHLETKKGTPTMGGILILASIIISTLLFANLKQGMTWVCLGVMIVFGIAGFIDDYVKVKKHTPNAMTAKVKLLIQFAVAAGVAYFATTQYEAPMNFSIIVPYLDFPINLWWFYIPFAMVVIAGASNAVNLSDGLDGLAAGLLIPPFMVLGFIALLIGFEYYDFMPFPSLSIICSAVIGACLGFLWFNCSPAQIFMGDTGSLSLGALLGTIAILAKQDLLLAIIGFVFVAEALSVMIQVFWYKRTKTRVFLMAPIHHHFEQKGWKETTVVIRFWVIGWLVAGLGMLAVVSPTAWGN
ncbi:MAG: phospho-N-acetylmuramoyl-pentapeptide-transferase [Alphaproteobacteria bacterium]|nr:phospho-N-acetylmuramoyl-pentapeptide-transferase [Alphaproteobacteria bacterium]